MLQDHGKHSYVNGVYHASGINLCDGFVCDAKCKVQGRAAEGVTIGVGDKQNVENLYYFAKTNKFDYNHYPKIMISKLIMFANPFC